MNLLSQGLVTIPFAAETLGIDVKRLRGYVYKGTLGDLAMPIGSLETDEVYGWSLKEVVRTAERGDAVI